MRLAQLAVAPLLLVMPSTLLALEPPGEALRLDRSRGGLPVVTVELGGGTLRAALDTGTTRSMIAADAAGRLGLEARARFEISTAAGPVRDARCAGPVPVRIGASEVSIDCLAWVPGEARLAGAPGVDLLLGADALATVSLWLDLDGGRARIAAPGELARWVRGERLAAERLERRPAIEATLPALGGAPLRLVIDSGADAPLLFGDAARRTATSHRGARRPARVETAAGSVERMAFEAGSVRLGGARAEVGWGLLLPEVADRQEDGLLPLAALGPVLFDLPSGLVVVGARLRSRPEPGGATGAVASLEPAR